MTQQTTRVYYNDTDDEQYSLSYIVKQANGEIIASGRTLVTLYEWASAGTVIDTLRNSAERGLVNSGFESRVKELRESCQEFYIRGKRFFVTPGEKPDCDDDGTFFLTVDGMKMYLHNNPISIFVFNDMRYEAI
jgi:hypothetical protein